ncbi:fluoride efflux transporter CrcB [Sphingobium sp. AN641]|uniref:fluoride efflux transporter CrcB n=1 Tax=Sphingobium sp. AN641 TaxID=3133443 RepID=UPI0030BAEA0C
MIHTVLVMVGGAVGAALRYQVGRLGSALLAPGFPWATLAVNVIGGFAMGLLAGGLARMSMGEPWRLLLGVGVLGGFTTFSAFSLETMLMLQRGQMGLAFIYVLASVIGSVAALFVGLSILRSVA